MPSSWTMCRDWCLAVADLHGAFGAGVDAGNMDELYVLDFVIVGFNVDFNIFLVFVMVFLLAFDCKQYGIGLPCDGHESLAEMEMEENTEIKEPLGPAQ